MVDHSELLDFFIGVPVDFTYSVQFGHEERHRCDDCECDENPLNYTNDGMQSTEYAAAQYTIYPIHSDTYSHECRESSVGFELSLHEVVAHLARFAIFFTLETPRNRWSIVTMHRPCISQVELCLLAILQVFKNLQNPVV